MILTMKHSRALFLLLIALAGAIFSDGRVGAQTIIYAVNDQNELISFDVSAPEALLSSVDITNTETNSDILAIDIRPSNGLLYGVDDSNNLYTLNPDTGAATLVAAISIELLGVDYGFDFNPVADALRIATTTDQNLRVDAATAQATEEGPLAYAANDPNTGTPVRGLGLAYTNSVAGATSTQLYALDANTDSLSTITPASSGILQTVGSLGVNAFTGEVAFDIVSETQTTQTAYAIFSAEGGPNSSLYQISLLTGQATLLGPVGDRQKVRGMAAASSLSNSEFNFSVLTQLVDEEVDGVPGVATVTVVRSGDLDETARVNFSAASATALADEDFTAVSGQLTFGPNTTTQTFQVQLLGDFDHEDLEVISVTLSNATGASLGAVSEMFLVIRDNEVAPRTIYVTDAADVLHSFNAAEPGVILASVPLVGIQNNEDIIGLDFRPATGQLYALGSNRNIYIVDPPTGSARRIAEAPIAAFLNGTEFGFDFNPVADAIRLTSDNGQNLRLDPDTGALLGTDTNLGYVGNDPNAGETPRVSASAYTNSLAAPGATTLYNLDLEQNVLVTQNPANNGTLQTVGPLGFDPSTTSAAGFDITARNEGYAIFRVSGEGSSLLYHVVLETGELLPLGFLGGGVEAQTMAVAVDFPFPSRTVYAVDELRNLITFDLRRPGAVASSRPLLGLGSENVLGLDFRPSSGQLYALTDASFIYTLNPVTGEATRVDASGSGLDPALTGTEYGFDFNPVPDAIRVVSDLDRNIRANPTTGKTIAEDGTLAYAAGDANETANPNIVAATYINSEPMPARTTLYDIDADLNILVRQNPPNMGTLNTVGTLTLDVPPTGVGLDSLPDGDAYATFTRPGAIGAGLYRVNLDTGEAKLIGPIGAGTNIRAMAIRFFPERTIYGVDTSNNLVRFKADEPSVILATRPITGLPGGESIIGIDFRPNTGLLYGLGLLNNIYTIEPRTGAATRVGTAAFSPGISGGEFGFDFNPVADRIRLVSDAEQNLRLHPDTGQVVVTDGTLAYASDDANVGANPNVVAAAYTDSAPGATATTLYNIDSTLDILVRQDPPNDGTLRTVRALGVDVPNALVGFDLLADSTGYASFAVPGETRSSLWRIDFRTGTTSFAGNIGAPGSPIQLRDISILPREESMVNISTRGETRTGDFTMIGGFIIEGTQPKTVLINGRGPSLTPFGVPNVLADPSLRLFSGQTVIASSNNWEEESNAAAINLSTNSGLDTLEPAILVTLDPGAYTAQLFNASGQSGQALIEIWDEGFPERSRLTNISTRGPVGTGNFVLIAGFIIEGPTPQTVLITGRGPSLAPFGVPNPLENPTLRLFDGRAEIAFNDDWMQATNAAEIEASPNGPTVAEEAAIRVTLDPGFYTAHLAGKVTATSDGTGQGLVEVWNETVLPTGTPTRDTDSPVAVELEESAPAENVVLDDKVLRTSR
jgi:hypothetical protein